MKENNEPIKDLKEKRMELIKKILVWIIVFFIVLMVITLNPDWLI